MKHFAELINALESTNKTNAKIDAIIDYLERAPDDDKLWFIALFTGKRPKRNVNTNYMKEWALEITQLPFWLFQVAIFPSNCASVYSLPVRKIWSKH